MTEIFDDEQGENNLEDREQIEKNERIETCLQPVIHLLLNKEWDESIKLLDKLMAEQPEIRCHRSLQMRYLALFWLHRFEEGAKDALKADQLCYDPMAFVDAIILKFYAGDFSKQHDFPLEENIPILANELCDPDVFLVGAVIFLANSDYQKFSVYLNRYVEYLENEGGSTKSYVYYVLKTIQNLVVENSMKNARATFEEYKKDWQDYSVESWIEPLDKYLDMLEKNPDAGISDLWRLTVIGPPLTSEVSMGCFITGVKPKW